MFLFAEEVTEQPAIAQFVNHYLGEPVWRFELAYTRPVWIKIFANFHTTPEKVFGSEYTPENAIPWYTIMFIVACILSVVIIKILKDKLSEDDPSNAQMTLEASFLYLKNLTANVIGEHGSKYFPVVATFAVLILVSNLMGQVPFFGLRPARSMLLTLWR